MKPAGNRLLLVMPKSCLAMVLKGISDRSTMYPSYNVPKSGLSARLHGTLSSNVTIHDKYPNQVTRHGKIKPMIFYCLLMHLSRAKCMSTLRHGSQEGSAKGSETCWDTESLGNYLWQQILCSYGYHMPTRSNSFCIYLDHERGMKGYSIFIQ